MAYLRYIRYLCIFLAVICKANSSNYTYKQVQSHISEVVDRNNELETDNVNTTTMDLYNETDIATEASTSFVRPRFNQSLCHNKVCVMKCCPQGEMMLHGACAPLWKNVTAWSVGLYEHELHEEDVLLQVSFPENPNPNATCIIHNREDFEIKKNGFLLFHNWEEEFDHQFYCLDTRISEDDKPQHFGALCYEPRQLSDFSRVARKVQVAGHIVSCVCLAVILVLHFPVSTPRNLQDKSFICLCISLLVGFILLILNMTPSVVDDISYSWCLLLALSSQYFLLSFYFWLAVRCYDILRIIWGSVNAVPMKTLNRSKYRFAKYCSISYGVPFVITACTAIVQHLPNDMVSMALRPNIANGRCWIEEKIWALGLYYYGYQILLHALNIIFMGISAYLLYREGTAFQFCRRHRNDGIILIAHNKPNLQMFWLQFYIFMLFVCLWAFDSLSLIYSKQHFWRLFDLLNSLQGLYLLMIVLKCSPKRIVFRDSIRRITGAAKTLSTKLKPKISFSPFSIAPAIPDSQVETSL